MSINYEVERKKWTKCKRPECDKPPAKGQVYCSRKCAPYGHLVAPRYRNNHWTKK